MYYNVSVLFSENKIGVFSHLPFASPVTKSKAEAEILFNKQLDVYTNGWRKGVNELVYDKLTPGNTSTRQALVKVNEAGYMHGYYLLVLNEWHHNPQE